MKWAKTTLEKTDMSQTQLSATLIRALGIATACAVFGDFSAAAPVDLTYEKTQTFKGRAFDKDEHVWIYNKAFADKFRMPSAWVSDDLKGIEAAAFRVGELELTCGLGRTEETCARLMQCILDIYIDEKRRHCRGSKTRTPIGCPGQTHFSGFSTLRETPPASPIPQYLKPTTQDSGHCGPSATNNSSDLPTTRATRERPKTTNSVGDRFMPSSASCTATSA